MGGDIIKEIASGSISETYNFLDLGINLVLWDWRVDAKAGNWMF